jgi:hypothetical protein
MYIEAKLDPKKNAWIELEGNVIIVGVKKKQKTTKLEQEIDSTAVAVRLSEL